MILFRNSQQSKAEFFSKMVNALKPLIVIVKSSELDVWLFDCFISEDFASWKTTDNIYTSMLEFTFSREDVID